MKRIYFVFILVALVLVAGCAAQTTMSGSTGNQQTSGGASAAGQGTQTASSGGQEQQTGASTNINIEIKNFAFSPQSITIKKGSTVTWEQMDSAPHTATSVSSPSGAAFDSGTLSKGASWSHTFNTAGTYEYYCAIHPNMKGEVIVE